MNLLKKYLVGAVVGLLPIIGNAESRPNIIFLMSDDQSFYTLGCYGNPDVQTPNLNRLAADGMAFDRHYATTAICMASRATVMSGMFEFKTGCNFMHGDMMEDIWKKSYPMLLREAGYRTGFAGKFGFSIRKNLKSKAIKNLDQYFDVWAGGHGQTSYKTAANEGLKKYVNEYPHSTLAYGAFGRDFIKESVGGEQPFCLSISFKAPHRPATPDPRFDEIYKGKTFTKPGNFGRENGAHFSKQSQADRQYERFHSWNYATKYDQVMATYHQQVYAIDQAVGMIREALQETGADKNTVIIYTADNGYFCGSHGYASKVLPYEEASRVPLIIFDPREKNSGKQLRSGSLSGLCDIAPTLLKLADLPVPDNMDGRDLMELYRDPSAEIHDALPLINVWNEPATHALSVVTKDQKYIYWGYAGDGYAVTEELYHLGKDPLELVNLAANPENSDMLNSMRKKYDRFLDQWKAEAVSYNDYERFGTLFDRKVEWKEKAKLLD
ncbi:sulfatase family protein [Pontiella agarivorans]|uniref:Sulfatase n=1 Tax=Pontiella agarivorans TaxID=3038953 RepID=A0ABU5MS11_9BACT|nr:sulfatase [Pontiella agarivorans]MDZ8116999.1 sulfatase [Pontiella agarivorans]